MFITIMLFTKSYVAVFNAHAA